MERKTVEDIDKELDYLMSLIDNGSGFGAPEAERDHDRKIQFLLSLRAQEIKKAGAIMTEVTMGDRYEVGQAGAVGSNAHAHDMTFNQISAKASDNFDLSALARELSTLRSALKAVATKPDHDIAIGAIASAETEAEKGNEPKVLEYLLKAGQWTFDVATKIGVTVAAAAIKEALGMK